MTDEAPECGCGKHRYARGDLFGGWPSPVTKNSWPEGTVSVGIRSRRVFSAGNEEKSECVTWGHTYEEALEKAQAHWDAGVVACHDATEHLELMKRKE